MTRALNQALSLDDLRRPQQGGERIGRSFRTERYRLVEWLPADPHGREPDIELYDYVADPLGTVNIARGTRDRRPTPRHPREGTATSRLHWFPAQDHPWSTEMNNWVWRPAESESTATKHR